MAHKKPPAVTESFNTEIIDLAQAGELITHASLVMHRRGHHKTRELTRIRSRLNTIIRYLQAHEPTCPTKNSH